MLNTRTVIEHGTCTFVRWDRMQSSSHETFQKRWSFNIFFHFYKRSFTSFTELIESVIRVNWQEFIRVFFFSFISANDVFNRLHHRFQNESRELFFSKIDKLHVIYFDSYALSLYDCVKDNYQQTKLMFNRNPKLFFLFCVFSEWQNNCNEPHLTNGVLYNIAFCN